MSAVNLRFTQGDRPCLMEGKISRPVQIMSAEYNRALLFANKIKKVQAIEKHVIWNEN
jgi:hypothetical protein